MNSEELQERVNEQTERAVQAAPDVQSRINANAAAQPVKLNIGGGDPESDKYIEMEGYTLVDRSVGLEAFPLDFDDESVDEVYASHVLEHFPYEQAEEVLKDWVRVLKPGGLLKVAVPDMKWLAVHYLKQSNVNIQGILMGGHVDANDHHEAIFDADSLRMAMRRAGLSRLAEWKSEVTDCASGDFSLNIMGFKPHGPTVQLPTVRGVLAAPRFAPTIHARCVVNAFIPLGIQTNIVMGCFWWKQICEGMEDALNMGAEYVLTMDYDSIFTAEDILELYHLLQAYPEIDAICALQSKRMSNEALLTLSEEEVAAGVSPMKFASDTTRIATGHFGCTMIRADRLRKLPHPWMVPTPGTDGRWKTETGAIDADIDFWHRWLAAGFNLHVANKVPIGHMQEFITWPTESHEPIHQPLEDYAKHGIPPELKGE